MSRWRDEAREARQKLHRLHEVEVEADALGEDTYRVRLTVHNTGWLPTYVTKKALEKKVVRGLVCEIELPQGATLETGKLRHELGQLEGRVYKPVRVPRNDESSSIRWHAASSDSAVPSQRQRSIAFR